MRASFLQGLVVTLAVGMIGCSAGGTETPFTGGSAGSGGSSGSGVNTGGHDTSPTGGSNPNGGTQALAGTGPEGGRAATGGAGPAGGGGAAPTGGGGAGGAGGRAAAGTGAGGRAAGGFGGSAAGGGGRAGAGGSAGAAATAGTSSAGTGSAGAPDFDCNTPMPTGGTAHTGSNVNGNADGLNYGIWTNGSGGTITTFADAHAFSTSWSNSQDFLAHLGLDFNSAKAYTAYGTILAQFTETKTGTSGGWSSIGIYGWMHNPCIEWYINEDSFDNLGARGGTMVTIDGGTYYLMTQQTTGTGGANACESGHTGSWTQIHSIRSMAHTCGTVTVSDHFAAWEAQGWTLGTLSMVHINIEVGGGTGSIEFPVANVTTTSK